MPGLTLSPAFIADTVAALRLILQRPPRPHRLLPSWEGLLFMPTNQGITAAVASRGAVALITAPLAQGQQQTWAVDPVAWVAWVVASGLDGVGEEPDRGGLEAPITDHGLCLQDRPCQALPIRPAAPIDLRGLVLPAMLADHHAPGQPGGLPASPLIPHWGRITTGALSTCWAGVSPRAVLIIEPDPGFNALKRNWLRELPVNLRPDEVRSLHRLSKQHRRPIRRIATEALREVIDREREGRWG